MVAELDSDIRKQMEHLRKKMAEAADGKELKKQLAKELRGLMNPLVTQQRERVRRLPSKGGHSNSMRQAIARQTKAATRWSGKSMGVSIVQRARSMPRDFDYAGRAFNRTEGWNPTSLGGETFHQQMTPTGWFDDVTAGKKPEVARKVQTALREAAAKIASSVHSA